MTKLYIIRHSLTEANEKHLYCGATDVPLSEAGRALAVSRRDAGGYPDASALRVITSGMLRTEETLSVLFGNIPHDTDPRLREMDFGRFEMHSYEEMKDRQDYIEWISSDVFSSAKCPGGECSDDLTGRVLEALEDILADGADTLIVCHGGVISALMTFLFPDEGKTLYEWQPGAAEGYEVMIDGSQGTRYGRIPFNR